MKQSNVYTLGLFLLVLLVSHEGITLAHNVNSFTQSLKFAKNCFGKVNNTDYTLNDKDYHTVNNLVTKYCTKFSIGFFNNIGPKNKEAGKQLWNSIKSSLEEGRKKPGYKYEPRCKNKGRIAKIM